MSFKSKFHYFGVAFSNYKWVKVYKNNHVRHWQLHESAWVPERAASHGSGPRWLELVNETINNDSDVSAIAAFVRHHIFYRQRHQVGDVSQFPRCWSCRFNIRLHDMCDYARDLINNPSWFEILWSRNIRIFWMCTFYFNTEIYILWVYK